MTGLKDLLASERGVLAIFGIIAATVLAGMGVLSNVEWLAFTGGVIGTTTISKTFTGVAEIKAGVMPAPASSPTIVGPVVGELVVDKPAGGS